MSRAERLLQLMQTLRRHQFPVSGATLARELDISLRTVYRDIASLQAQGARIAAEPGLGYLLQPGFVLPPLMFSEEEIDALVLGTRWVVGHADRRLGQAARNLLAKVAAVLPAELRHELEASALLVGAAPPAAAGDLELAHMRSAIRAERKLDIIYRDPRGLESRRTIWPFALGFFEQARVLAAWCELRQQFRHFRADRIVSLTLTPERYPRRRQALLKEWREKEGIASGSERA
ncbi:putative DNA-binding transcriptional regulator YafY [Oxalobacteraceae bacterium GrIS 1.11]